MKKNILLLLSVATLISCEDETDNSVFSDRKLIAELKAKSVDTLVIEENKLILNAFTWVDFMPGSDKKLMSSNTLYDVNSKNFSSSIDLVKQYVIYNDLVWITDYDTKSKPTPPYNTITKTSSNGPKWNTGADLYIVAKVIDSKTNTDYYIKTSSFIFATY